LAIKSFKDKELRKCWEHGKSSKINNKLDYLDAATELKDLAFPPSNKLHRLGGKLAGYYAISINGPWRLIFQFRAGNAYNVYFENYH
jgi:proteic killer suppression protein